MTVRWPRRVLSTSAAVGESLGPLAGVPLALKDIITTADMPTTCGSRILQGWRSPYDATVTGKLRAAGIVILGKTNLDEFAMGSSTENSAFGPTHNPWDLDRIPAVRAADRPRPSRPFRLPRDRDGHRRLDPATRCGHRNRRGQTDIRGVSRYGLVACASSLDQAGPCARTVLDAAMLHEVIAGHDPMDSTSIDEPVPAVVAAAKAGASGDLSGLRIGVVTEMGGEGIRPGSRSASGRRSTCSSISALRSARSRARASATACPPTT